MNRLKNSEIPAYRENQLQKQSGLDPITMQKITVPCLDHDHVSGVCRQVLDRETNAFEGKVFNAWRRYLRYKGVTLTEAVNGLTRYYLQDYSCNPLHPTFRTKDEKRELRNLRARRRRDKKNKPKDNE